MPDAKALLVEEFVRLRHGWGLEAVNLHDRIGTQLADLAEISPDDSDRTIRLALLDRLRRQKWTDFGSRNIIVQDGIVHLWGLVGSESERKALTALAHEVPGVSEVADKMIPAY